MLNAFVTLAVRTLTDPRAVAADLMGMSLPRNTLWIALALAVVLNTLVYQLTLVIAPPPMPLPGLLASPVAFAVFVAAGLVLSIYALTYVGRTLGGKGSLETIMTLLIWLQYLRFAVQVLALVLSPVIPGLAGLLVFAASLYGIWLLLNFVDVGHGINNLITSLGVLIMTMLAITLGLAMLLSLVGIQNLGLTPYV